jgi:hypothetical protein
LRGFTAFELLRVCLPCIFTAFEEDVVAIFGLDVFVEMTSSGE